MEENNNKREEWGTKVGLVLALAGNAIGLGNLLLFSSIIVLQFL